ncbi:hypothetical protein GCM10010222_56680 [Streptomyces tanashiensis]|uniref:hypothetical protein n=1 Tax=Streptomyces tanashiensis TaxID=67367 RepID=UPI001672FC82|nr:hypothetical protein [Streptomyces tanashiensis]GGT07428.1 hypothetical protein GCM10010222_56680 [Streptomyces tanashiensis]
MSAPALAPRLLRAAVFTAVCVVLSALGHALAACAGIALWTVVAGFLGVFGVTVLFTGRERSLGFVVGALAGGQLGLHVLFGIGQRQLTLSGQADDALVRMAARLVCGAGTAALEPADAARILTDAGVDPASAHSHMGHTTALAATPSGEVLPGLPMLLGHLLAALATGWLLRRGDHALGRLVDLSEQGATELAECALVRSLRAALRLVRALLAGLPAAPRTGPRRTLRAPSDSSPPPVAEALQHTVIRRGPPAADCVLAA